MKFVYAECRQKIQSCMNTKCIGHTETCKKNDSMSGCLFNFPRKECAQTSIVAHSSVDYIQNRQRICLLMRSAETCSVNNYNLTLLSLWKENMDIQQCGSNVATASNVAKYITKSEPTQVDSTVAQAIR